MPKQNEKSFFLNFFSRNFILHSNFQHQIDSHILAYHVLFQYLVNKVEQKQMSLISPMMLLINYLINQNKKRELKGTLLSRDKILEFFIFSFVSSTYASKCSLPIGHVLSIQIRL
jgi:hypothetical protein